MLLAFLTNNRKIIKFSIDKRIIIYFDDIWKQGIQIMPKDQNLIEKLRRSGKSNLKEMAKLIIESNSGKSIKEYEKCSSDDELAKMVRKDCRKKGLMEVS